MPPIYYPAVVDRSASGYGVTFPDFPGCVAAGATVQQAAANAEAALALHLDGMRADKDAIPQPSSLDDIEPAEGAEDVARVLIRAEAPGSFSRVQVTIEDSVLAAIDAVATNRSAFLTDAARAALYADAQGRQLPKAPIAPARVARRPQRPARPPEGPPSTTNPSGL